MREPSGGAGARTGRGRATRSALVDAAWELLDELPLSELLGAASVQEVASEAGVTTGALFHHFPNREVFVDAMVLHLLESSRNRVTWETVDGIRAIATQGPPSDVRREVERFVRAIDDESVRTSFSRLLLVLTRPPEHEVAGRSLGPLLVEKYWDRTEGAQRQLWELTLELLGRWPRPPFGLPEMTIALAAIGFGATIWRWADPEALPDDALAATVPAFVAAMTASLSEQIGLEELEAGLAAQFQTTRGSIEPRRALAARAADVLSEGWEHLSLAAVAEQIGASLAELSSAFTTVRRVAAFAFYAVLEPAEWFDATVLDLDPPAEAPDVIRALATAVRARPDLARAHAAERSEDVVRHGDAQHDEDVRAGGALGAGLLRVHVREAEGQVVSLARVTESVVTVVDSVLALGLRPELELEEVVEIATALWEVRPR